MMRLLLAAMLIGLAGTPPALAADPPVGRWKTIDEKTGKIVSEVELYDQGGKLYGKSDDHASAPTESAVHPIELLATIYHALGIDPTTEVMNDLNQPRALVDAQPVLGLFS